MRQKKSGYRPIYSFALYVYITLMFITPAGAQILRKVKWSFEGKKINQKEAEVILTATIDKGWHIYAQSLPPGDGPVPTSFKFVPSKTYVLEGKTQDVSKPVVEFDPTFKKNIGFYASSVQFKQRILVKTGTAPGPVKGSLEFMACSNSQCLPPETVEFSVALK